MTEPAPQDPPLRPYGILMTSAMERHYVVHATSETDALQRSAEWVETAHRPTINLFARQISNADYDKCIEQFVMGEDHA